MSFFSRQTFRVPTALSYLQKCNFFPISPLHIVRFKKFQHKRGSLFERNIFSTHSFMLSSKLQLLPYISAPCSQIWNIPRQKWVIFFKTNILSMYTPMLSLKRQLLPHISSPCSQIWKIQRQNWVLFSRLTFWVHTPYVIFESVVVAAYIPSM